MIITGIDPGTKQSAIVTLTLDGTVMRSISYNLTENERVEDILRWDKADVMVYEWIQNYGRVVGEEVLRTAYWCGRFASAAENSGMLVEFTTRPKIVRHFTGQTNVKKAHVRQAILDRFGGSSAKRKGNILHGISNHLWDALAVAMFMLEEKNVCKPEDWVANA